MVCSFTMLEAIRFGILIQTSLLIALIDTVPIIHKIENRDHSFMELKYYLKEMLSYLGWLGIYKYPNGYHPKLSSEKCLDFQKIF